MFRVQYKYSSGMQGWTNAASVGSEAAAMAHAQRLVGRYAMVRVVDPNGYTVWSG
jgi:hypothetical protein